MSGAGAQSSGRARHRPAQRRADRPRQVGQAARAPMPGGRSRPPSSGYVEFSQVIEDLPDAQGPADRRRRLRPQDEEGRVRHADRPLGLRQVDGAVDGRRPQPDLGGGIILDNREVVGAGPDRAVVFQAPSLMPWLTARENVALGVDRGLSQRQPGRARATSSSTTWRASASATRCTSSPPSSPTA